MLLLLKAENGELSNDKDMVAMVEQRHFLERQKDREDLN
jgi:hypothetical protein